MNTESGVWQDGSELEETINVWPRGLLMVQLWAQGRGEVTPVIMCQHTASLCHCWPSPGRATLQWDVGRSLWSPFVPAMWRAFHINTSSQRKGLIWILQEEHCQVSVRSQTPSFWLLSPLFGKCSLFNWLFWRQWCFFFWWSTSGINLQKPVGLFLGRNYPRSNPCWPNPTAEPIEDRHSPKITEPSSEQGFSSSKTKSLKPSLYEEHNFFH